MTITKNLTQFNKNHADNKISIAWYLFFIILFPLVTLIFARYYMLRRGRALNKISFDPYSFSGRLAIPH